MSWLVTISQYGNLLNQARPGHVVTVGETGDWETNEDESL
jgi:hypothetical protein